MEDKIKILIVDDEPAMRDGLADVLEEKGYGVSTAENGYEALERAKRIPFDLIIADLRMPGLSGLEMVENLRQINPDIMIVAMTAYGAAGDGAEAVRRGAFDYIAKPFTMEEMDKVIEKAAQWRELCREKRQLSEELERTKERLKKGEEQLIQSRRLATIGRLGAGISHEVKNLLGIISVSTHYLKDKLDKGKPKAIKHLESIEREIRRSNEIVLGLLNLCRQPALAPRPTEVNEVVEEIVSLTEHQMALQNIKTIRKYADNLPEIIVNPDELEQVFINMIFNAQDAMPEGGELRIGTGLIEKDGQRYVRVEFTDTGHGIPEEILKSIPQRFLTTKKGSENVGLGLPVSYKIVEGYRGWIEVTSEVGKGTTFLINLPSALQEETGTTGQI